MSKIAQARFTGRRLDHPSGTFHEVICVHPDCQMRQFHPAGKASCILCSTPFQVQTLHLVSKPAPGPSPEPPPEEHSHESQEE